MDYYIYLAENGRLEYSVDDMKQFMTKLPMDDQTS